MRAGCLLTSAAPSSPRPDDDGDATVNQYGPYGEPASSNQGRFQYTGQMWLAEAGADLYYYKARIYSASLGRFLSVDPIGYADNLNPYAYVGNDPVNFVDPWGLFQSGNDQLSGLTPVSNELLGLSSNDIGWNPTDFGAANVSAFLYPPSFATTQSCSVLGLGCGPVRPQSRRVPWEYQPWHFISGGRATSGIEYFRGVAGELGAGWWESPVGLGGVAKAGAAGVSKATILAAAKANSKDIVFKNLKDHARRHGGNLTANAYRAQAIRHLSTGTPFKFRHDEVQKVAYITRTGANQFLFTSASRSGNQIFTHMSVNQQYLRNIGITLPQGF